MDRRRFLKTAAGLFVPAAPAILLPKSTRAQGGMGPGPGMAHSTGGGALGLQTNLSAFFELDNSLADSTGNVTNLTNNNSVTFVTDTPGATGQQCANFVSASSQSLSHVDDVALRVGGVDWTLSAWSKYTVFGAGGQTVTKRTTGFPQNGYVLGTAFTTGNRARGQITANAGTISPTGDTFGALSTSTWYLFVLTYVASTRVGSISVNGGAFDSPAAGAAAISSDTAQFNIGVDSGGTNFLSGRVCRVGLWKNRILSGGDVTALYNGGAGLTYAGMA